MPIVGPRRATSKSNAPRRAPGGRQRKPGGPRSAPALSDLSEASYSSAESPRTSTAWLSKTLLGELQTGAALLGVALGAQELASFSTYAALLEQWASRMNLTRLTSPEEIVYGHFLDSLTCLFADPFPMGASVVDIGTGAGFPGVPIKIARPDVSLTLLDASRRRVAFLEILVDRLGISAETVHGRGETLGRDGIRTPRRETYDRIVSRATAPLPDLLQIALPMLRVGGRGVFPKGPAAMDEVAAAGEVLRAHSAGVVSVVAPPEMPFATRRGGKIGPRYVVVVEKSTPDARGRGSVFPEVSGPG